MGRIEKKGVILVSVGRLGAVGLVSHHLLGHSDVSWHHRCLVRCLVLHLALGDVDGGVLGGVDGLVLDVRVVDGFVDCLRYVLGHVLGHRDVLGFVVRLVLGDDLGDVVNLSLVHHVCLVLGHVLLLVLGDVLGLVMGLVLRHWHHRLLIHRLVHRYLPM